MKILALDLGMAWHVAAQALRAGVPYASERAMQDALAQALRARDVRYQREVRLAPRCRIDFVVGTGTGIECKIGKPTCDQVVRQLARYAATGVLREIWLITERGLHDLPREVEGLTCHRVVLTKCNGVAV